MLELIYVKRIDTLTYLASAANICIDIGGRN